MTGDYPIQQIVAAGGVVLDPPAGTQKKENSDAGQKVVVVHRPKHADWSLPKGKHSEGESLEQTALREVLEETGLQCRIVRPIAASRYEYHTRQGDIRLKTVHYFLMEVVGGTAAGDGSEVDRVEWIEVQKALQLLTYEGDKRVLAGFVGRKQTGE
ncbi:MAG TPA: NUDIX hydrolase [Blastocatellia bacterium]